MKFMKTHSPTTFTPVSRMAHLTTVSDDLRLEACYVGSLVGYICKEYVVFNIKLFCGLLIIQLRGQFYFILFLNLS